MWSSHLQLLSHWTSSPQPHYPQKALKCFSMTSQHRYQRHHRQIIAQDHAPPENGTCQCCGQHLRRQVIARDHAPTKNGICPHRGQRRRRQVMARDHAQTENGIYPRQRRRLAAGRSRHEITHLLRTGHANLVVSATAGRS